MATSTEFLTRDIIRRQDQSVIQRKFAELSSLASGIQSMLQARSTSYAQRTRIDVERAYDAVGRANALILELRLLALTEDEEEQISSARSFLRSALEMIRHRMRAVH